MATRERYCRLVYQTIESVLFSHLEELIPSSHLEFAEEIPVVIYMVADYNDPKSHDRYFEFEVSRERFLDEVRFTKLLENVYRAICKELGLDMEVADYAVRMLELESKMEESVANDNFR